MDSDENLFDETSGDHDMCSWEDLEVSLFDDDDAEADPVDSNDAMVGISQGQDTCSSGSASVNRPPQGHADDALDERSHPGPPVLDMVAAAIDNVATQLSQGAPVLTINFSSHHVPHRVKTALQNLRFPGKTAEESWRFSVVLQLLNFIREAHSTRSIMSKRDMYYRDPTLFGTQATVDRYIDIIASSLGVTRAGLRVTAAAKGLITGAVAFHRSDGTILDCTTDAKSTLISHTEDFSGADMTSVKWILVVEKEASYQTIVQSQIWQHLRCSGIMLTGKGYPDLRSRQMLHSLATPSSWNRFADLPAFCLTDYDPDGMAIFNTFKYGSAGLSHESNTSTTPRLQRLGICTRHIERYTADSSGQALLPMAKRDRRLAQKMLAHQGKREVARDLQVMLFLDVKAELQIMDDCPGELDRLLGSLPT